MRNNAVFYNGLTLSQNAQQQTKTKNTNAVNGIYQARTEQKYFVKVPHDKRELFTEAFAGTLITKLKQRGYINSQYHDALICADFCEVQPSDSEQTWGLIQPAVQFTPIFKLFGNPNQVNRSSADEFFNGKELYRKIHEAENTGPGLPIMLLVSLLIGDYSVHSDNVVKLTQGESAGMYGRIDWGAAFRNFVKPENNQDILKPFEHQDGVSGFVASLYKDYITYFQSIPGLYTAVAAQAYALEEILTLGNLEALIKEVCDEIPNSIFSESELAGIAKYMGFNAKENFLNNPETHTLLAETMLHRLNLIQQLKSENEADQNYSDETKPQIQTMNLCMNMNPHYVHNLADSLARVRAEIDFATVEFARLHKIDDALHAHAATEFNISFEYKEGFEELVLKSQEVISKMFALPLDEYEQDLLTELNINLFTLNDLLNNNFLNKANTILFSNIIESIYTDQIKLEQNNNTSNKLNAISVLQENNLSKTFPIYKLGNKAALSAVNIIGNSDFNNQAEFKEQLLREVPNLSEQMLNSIKSELTSSEISCLQHLFQFRDESNATDGPENCDRQISHFFNEAFSICLNKNFDLQMKTNCLNSLAKRCFQSTFQQLLANSFKFATSLLPAYNDKALQNFSIFTSMQEKKVMELFQEPALAQKK